MKQVDLLKSSQMTAQNTHRVVMIYENIQGQSVAIGNCFVSKQDNYVPKSIEKEDIGNYSNYIDYICYYENI